MMHLSTVAKLLGTALTIQAGESIIIGYGFGWFQENGRLGVLETTTEPQKSLQKHTTQSGYTEKLKLSNAPCECHAGRPIAEADGSLQRQFQSIQSRNYGFRLCMAYL